MRALTYAAALILQMAAIVPVDAQSFDGAYRGTLNCAKLSWTKAPLTDEPVSVAIMNGKVSYSHIAVGYLGAMLCGSTVTVDVQMDGPVVTDFANDVKACALGQASSSIMARHVIGSNPGELRALRETVRKMLKENGPPPTGKWADIAVLEPVTRIAELRREVRIQVLARGNIMTDSPLAVIFALK